MTVENFKPNGLPLLIGSFPVNDHNEAAELVFKYTPDIPIWVQLPVYPEEGMIRQFTPGLPGLVVENDRFYIDLVSASFNDALLRFYETYMAVAEGPQDLETSPFGLEPDVAKGFFVLLDKLDALARPPKAVKGHITGPITFATSVKDQEKRAIFYDDQIRDAAVKLIAMKAAWQVRKLKKYNRPVIIFLDEPALAGYGSSEFISIDRQDISNCFKEVIDAIHKEGGLAGIHVCANSDWTLLFDSDVDIVNFDAYAYFDKFIIYGKELKKYLDSGRYVAWGIVPTLQADCLAAETEDSLIDGWRERAEQIKSLGIDYESLLQQSFITPSCGMGSLSRDHAIKALDLTQKVTNRVRSGIDKI